MLNRLARRLPNVLSVAALLLAGGAEAQFIPAENADADAMYAHFKKAQQIAGLDLYPHFAHACIVDQHYRWTISRGIQQPGDIRPLQVMDNLYFIGQNAASSWAIRTSEGLIVIDALNNGEEAEKYIVGGLRELGLDPAEIKYVVVTHAHGDHFGGANYLKDSFGARIAASKVDWGVMEKMKTAPKEPPAAGRRRLPEAWARLAPERDVEIEDGQAFRLGDTTLRFYITPGHTPGTLALIFESTDRGEPHVAALYGSLGMPASLEDKKTVLASIDRFRKLAEEAGVDTLIANHQTRDLALQKLEILRLRRDGDPNPFVVGKQGYLRYMDIQTECVYYAIAREGQM
ncbi:MAG: MBL fold metallo-hydrolase [Acidobacteria bacterium]|nr:MBL fold metallo-hydrolase [Acidobacteriota bacterium]